MNRSRAVPVLIAVLSISALGVAATTLETTLSADPDDAINPDWNRLPIGQGDAATIEDEIADGTDEGEAQRSDPGDGTEDTEGGGADGADRSANDGEDPGGGASSGLRNEDGTGESTALDSLLARLSTLIRAFFVLVAAVAVGAVAYRYRAELRVLFGREPSTEASVAATTDADPWPGAEPSNVVDRAWLTVVRRVDPDHPETMTVAECTALARERGSDAAATEAIATAFERVHYGASSVADEERRARVGLRRLDGDDG